MWRLGDSNTLWSCRRPAGGKQVPVAVPEKIYGLTLILDFVDRCHSLTSLYLPLAALGSLPTGLSHLDGFESPVDSKKGSHP